MHSTWLAHRIVDQELQDRRDLFVSHVLLEQLSNDHLHRLIILLLHQVHEAVPPVVNDLDGEDEDLKAGQKEEVSLHAEEHLS